jgi:hypothetical protein
MFMIFLAIAGGIRGYSSIPYWDMWEGALNFVIKASDGDWSVWWAQHNEHRIVLSRLLFWADINWFGGLSISLIAENFLIVGMSATVLWRVLYTYTTYSLDRSSRILIACFITGWLFQWMQSQNFIWGFQSQFLLVQLLPLCAFFYLSKSISRSRLFEPNFLLACLMGVLSVGTMANGLIVLPMMFVYQFFYRQSKSKLGVIAFLATVTAYFYLIDYKSPSSHSSILETVKHDPIGFIQYALIYIGSPFHYLSHGWLTPYLSLFFGAVFIILYGAFFARCARSFKNNPLRLALIFYIAFIICTALVTGGGRLVFGLQQALESRYTTPAIMAWAALIILFSPYLSSIVKKFGWIVKLPILLLCLAMISLQLRALDPQVQYHFLKRVAALGLSMGIPDPDRITAIYPSAQGALDIAKVAQQNNLAFFNTEPYRSASKLFDYASSNKDLPQCEGFIDGIETVKESSNYARLSGWVFNPALGSQPTTIKFLNQNNLVVGYAIVGGYRPDLQKAIDPRAIRAGFEGYVDLSMMGQMVSLQDFDGLCATKLLPIPIQPFATTETLPDTKKTQVTKDRVRARNQWIGSDFERSQYEGMVVYGSYINSDADTGSIEMTIKPGDKLFYRSGPTYGKQILEIPGKNIAVVLPVAQKWTLLDFNGLSNSKGNEVVIKMTDKGSSWGEWSSIAVNK